MKIVSATTLLATLAASAAPPARSLPPARTAGTLPLAQPPAAAGCDDRLAQAFQDDKTVRVVLVRRFNQGERVALAADEPGRTARHDLCLVKLLVGPPTLGRAHDPSTSPGIGIAIWLPSPASWTGRFHALGGSGFAGPPDIASPHALGDQHNGTDPVAVADDEGSVSAITDTGHVGGTGAFGLLPDGRLNQTGWANFASRAVHLMAVDAKAVARRYYGAPVRFAYWDGCSTGGRQGLKEAQAYPEDFDGILAGAPAINWTRFITSELYGQIAVQRDLAGVPLSDAQLLLASQAAVDACDTALTGQHDGFITDLRNCRYNPAKDRDLLCAVSGGSATGPDCLTRRQADVMLKLWYGQTEDGSVPDPAVDTGTGDRLARNQLWFGIERGARLGDGFLGLMQSKGGTPAPFPIATAMVAMEQRDPSLAEPSFKNRRSDGRDGWKALSYRDLAQAARRGVSAQPALGDINTDDPDLSAFRARGGKLLQYHGLADEVIPAWGSIHYASQVAAKAGGWTQLGASYRLYTIPGWGHCMGVGSVGGTSHHPANPPIPADGQMYRTLVDWVERRKAPDEIVLSSPDAAISRPVCPYPSTIRYRGGDASKATSFSCA